MRLERLLVAVVVLVSGVVAVGATAVQLYAEYRQDRDRLDAGVREVTASFIEPLTEAVWVDDQALIDATLAGLRELPGVVLAEVRTPAEAAAVGSAGPLPPHQSERALPLERVYREQTIPLGTLVVRTSFADVIDRLVIILLTNFGKTLFVSIIMLLVFRRLVTRHLLRIARHVHSIDPGRPPEHLALPGRRPAEELAEVADAINLLEARIHTQLRGEGDLRRELERGSRSSARSIARTAD